MSRRPYTPGVRALDGVSHERLSRERGDVEKRFPLGWWFRPYDGTVAFVTGYHPTKWNGWQLRVRYHDGTNARLYPLEQYVASPPAGETRPAPTRAGSATADAGERKDGRE